MKFRRRLFGDDPNQIPIDWHPSNDPPPSPPPSDTGKEVITEKPPQEETTRNPVRTRRPQIAPHAAHRRIVARFPVPRPLPSSVAAGRFGHDEQGRPIRPAADEVRAITDNQAEKLIAMLDAMTPRPGNPATADTLPETFGSIIAAYTEDFGEHAARQLEAYARRQALLDESDRTDQGWRR